MHRSLCILGILFVSLYAVVFVSPASAASVQVAHHTAVPHASCWATGCDGRYPGPNGCETSRSLDLQQDTIYDNAGHLVGVQHFYDDQDCFSFHTALWVGYRCISGGNAAIGNLNTKDQVGATSPSSACPSAWVDSVMDEYQQFVRCDSAWVGGNDNGRDGNFFYNHKLVYGGAGC